MSLPSSLPTKRSASPLPRHFDETIKIRLTDAQKKEQPSVLPAVHSSVPAQQGQEILSLSTSLQGGVKHENINDLILETTLRLGREGKRITRAPRLL